MGLEDRNNWTCPTKSAEFAQLLLTGGLWLRARLVLFLSKLNGVGRLVTPQGDPIQARARGGGLVYVCAWQGYVPAIRWFIFFFFLNYTDWISRHHFILRL